MRSAADTRSYLIAALAGLLGALPALAADWPTVHHDSQRSGATTDSVRGPYRLD
jgi:hypothetical protein